MGLVCGRTDKTVSPSTGHEATEAIMITNVLCIREFLIGQLFLSVFSLWNGETELLSSMLWFFSTAHTSLSLKRQNLHSPGVFKFTLCLLFIYSWRNSDQDADIAESCCLCREWAECNSPLEAESVDDAYPNDESHRVAESVTNVGVDPPKNGIV